MLFVFSSGDLGITYVTRRLGALESLEDLGAKLVVVDGPDHTFRPLWSHDVLRQAVESHLALLGVRSRSRKMRLTSQPHLWIAAGGTARCARG